MRETLESVPSPGSFADLLRVYRKRRKLSQNQLAHLAGVVASYVSRLEKIERDPPRRIVVLAFGRILGLSTLEANQLLVAAGHAPLIEVPWDDALEDVAGVLRVLTADEQVTFRAHLRRFCGEWMPDRPVVPAPMPIPAPVVEVRAWKPWPPKSVVEFETLAQKNAEFVHQLMEQQRVQVETYTPTPVREVASRMDDGRVGWMPVSGPAPARKVRTAAPVVKVGRGRLVAETLAGERVGTEAETLAKTVETLMVGITPVPPRNGEAAMETPWANVDVVPGFAVSTPGPTRESLALGMVATPVSAPVAPRKARPVVPVVVREECCRVCRREFGVDRLRSWADEDVCEECS